MRSAMAEALMERHLRNSELEGQAHAVSAGLHAVPGREAHPWAQQASADLGISLLDHRAQLLTREMVEQADCVFAMDFQNKAELLTLYPEAQEKICMLSTYAEGEAQFREIRDPYLADLEETRKCGRLLETCVRNLLVSIFPGSADRLNQASGQASPMRP